MTQLGLLFISLIYCVNAGGYWSSATLEQIAQIPAEARAEYDKVVADLKMTKMQNEDLKAKYLNITHTVNQLNKENEELREVNSNLQSLNTTLLETIKFLRQGKK